ncbi:hypothetical protein SAMN05216567_121125 [Variovorax sp. OK605]|uniref:hypothetical protein n=1 Tax=Variovorax sp. OK605 TaxID=1855317 RepID=UPI0008F3F729|nr:hypothetical protein [Variovorax sp. OK605]SFQ60593.1 hypothetical protein SAMN05216567_121125 [Variovorax sp. OK605]
MLNKASTTTAGPAFGAGYFQTMLNWQLIVGNSLLAAQREQWEMLAAWQRSVGALQRDVADRWICRFGGGVPLDG